ncbi:Eco57I restriction-modification methylase domain-containing protein [Porphyromonas gingivalis]|uniref:site-specific DNA-methyltransferase (adenine-specific) n=1 Tax=Porphyromonas gingivalis TaxID=837 RepID=A0AAE9X963_PORGN|nr:Eco57I restriction-modification methylase domain-containing protein [Porphyromonas gingivalis]WCF98127.1 Eco57I restriction-modification methylase domain-containing protein [Porphyromonas gingivalis]
MNYKEVIESRYNREAWQQLLHDIFRGKVSFWNHPSEVHVSSRLAKQALNLGKISLADGESIAVYEVELADKVDIERNRRGIRDMLTSDWRNMGYAGAFMFCYRKNESILRFSYVSETWGFNKQGEYEKISTDTKRYTYLLGEGRGCRTAIEQFGILKNSKQSLSDITAAFSVEALTKQFYKDLFEWYQWAVDDSSNVTFPNNTIVEDDDKDDIEKKIIRMITRIMFVWFIKQKDLVPHCIFDIDFLSTILKDFDPYSTTIGNYYNAILQNLFFGTLNRAINDEEGNTRKFASSSKRDVKTLYRYAEMFSISEQEVINLFSEVPFLNGGLFECLDKTKYIDGVEQCYNFDGFSRNNIRFADGRFKHRAVVPNNLFFEPDKGLISILTRYNFTIEENSPEEQQVALDPELLGKVFENLLGAYNPETKETARNQSGSFYTPREIVNYMVDESLIAYLGDNDFVRPLFRNDFSFDNSKAEEYKKISDKLKTVKVLDPACGSGAFPMGLLNRMIDILERISPDEHVYDLKLSVIENCLYGSDIQSIAAQITKLRFFISLICNCEKDSSKPNFGIPTLPNLETKFVSANSLIAKKKKSIQGNLFENPEIELTKNELADVRHKHFSAKSASTKHRLREKDQALREKLAKLLSDDDNFAPEDAKQLAAWNPYDQNAVSPFFDPEWMFGVTDGFDIVIGNPPYIQLQNNGGELAKLYEGCDYSTFARTGDIYCLFYERAWQLLKERGHLCYITSNKWMRAGYGEKTREFFANKTNPMLLIDFAGVKIFESATVDTNILLFSKSSNRHETVCAVTNKQNKDSVKNLSDFVQQQNSICGFSNSDSWIILSPIEQSIKRKIEAVGTPLKDWDIQINYGIKTGFNDAFIISTEKREEILANCQTEDEHKRTAELIRPILRGRDIKRYGYVDNGLYLINTHNGIRGKLPRIDINDYPAIKAHLDQYWDRIATRADKGDTPYNLRNCAYLEDFSKPKIIWKIIGSRLAFAIDNNGIMLNNACYLLTGNHLAHILGFLNSSSLIWYSEITNMNKTGVGDAQVGAQNIILFPIPSIIDEEVVEIVEQLLSNPANSNLKRILSERIYAIYGLDIEERSYLESLNL